MQSKIIPTDSTTATIRYVMSPKVGREQRVEERVAQVYAQHSGISTAAADFLDLRQEHGQQGKMRKGQGRYYTPDDPDDATHLKIGKNWRVARPGEVPTHARVAPKDEVVLCHEGYHFEYSFARHEVNPDDPQQTAEAFRFIQESLTEMYPGEQMLMVGQTDAEGSPEANDRGEGGKYHVHVVVNAVLAKDMELEGERYRAGQRLRGTLTNIDEMRHRMDERLNERHAEYGLPAQKLASVGSAEYERGKGDPASYWARRKGQISDQDKVREGVDLAIEHMSVAYAGSLTGLDRNERMRAFSDTLEAITDGDVTTSLRETKTGDVKLRSYKVAGRKGNLAKRSLGPRFGDAGVQDQIEQAAQGNWERVAAHQNLTHLPVREVGELPEVDRQELIASLEALAAKHGRSAVPTTPEITRVEKSAPADVAESRLDAIMADVPTESRLDAIMSDPALDLPKISQIPGAGPEPPAAQGAQVEDEDLEVAPRRRRGATTDEDRDRDETAPTVTEPVQSPQTAQEPVAAPPAAPEPAEPSEGRQEPRAYTKPREPEQPKKVASEKPAPKKALVFDGFFGVNKTGLEMIALQSARNPQKLDIQLRAGTADAAGRQVLSLAKTDHHPRRFLTYSEHKLAEIERAAGSNRAEVEGGHVLGFRADVEFDPKYELWLPSHFEKSQLEPVTPDTMLQQVEAQHDARMRGLVSRSRQNKLGMNAQRHQMPEISRDHDRGYGLGG